MKSSCHPALPLVLLDCPAPQPRGQLQLLPSSQNTPRQVLRVTSSPSCELLESRDFALLMAAAPRLAERGAVLVGWGMTIGGPKGDGVDGEWLQRLFSSSKAELWIICVNTCKGLKQSPGHGQYSMNVSQQL